MFDSNVAMTSQNDVDWWHSCDVVSTNTRNVATTPRQRHNVATTPTFVTSTLETTLWQHQRKTLLQRCKTTLINGVPVTSCQHHNQRCYNVYTASQRRHNANICDIHPSENVMTTFERHKKTFVQRCHDYVCPLGTILYLICDLTCKNSIWISEKLFI
jgi:hypothetical protein